MQNRKRIWWKGWLLALAALALTACGGEGSGTLSRPPAEEPVVSQEAEPWRDAYKAFLADLCKADAEVRDVNRPDYDPNSYPAQVDEVRRNYFLYDMDWDGVPELILRSNFYQSDISVYTFRDGKLAEAAGQEPLGDRYVQFYTCPEEPGLMVEEAVKGYFFVYPLTLSEDGLHTGEYRYETDTGQEGWDGWDYAYPGMAALVPGSTRIRDARAVLHLTYGKEFDSCADQPLTLPVEDYGRERSTLPLDLARDGAARAAIQAVLDGEAPLTGVSADGYGGDTGEMLLAGYLAPGGVDEYADTAQTVEKLAWADMNGDGQSECLLRLKDAEGQPDQYVILAEEGGTVYAYCVNYYGSALVDRRGVFCGAPTDGCAFAVSFAGEQAYLYSVGEEDCGLEMPWQTP